MTHHVYLNGVDNSTFIIPDSLEDVLLETCTFPIKKLYTGTLEQCQDMTNEVYSREMEEWHEDLMKLSAAITLVDKLEMPKEQWDQWLKDQFENDPGNQD